MKNKVALFLTVLLLAQLAACTSVRPARGALSYEVKEKALPAMERPSARIGANIAAVDYVTVSDHDDFVLKEMSDSDPLPNLEVRGFSYTNAALYDVIRTLVEQLHSDVTLSFDVSSTSPVRKVISGYNVKGKFSTIIENLSATAGFYYRYKDGVLTIKSDKQYITALPPINELFESIPSVIRTMGGTDVVLDRSARIVTFRANKPVHEKIDSYLMYIRKNRSLITYESYIWEVALNDQSQMGINWRDFPISAAGESMKNGVGVKSPANGGAFTAAFNLTNPATVGGGAGIGIALKGAQFTLSTLIDFLQTQGTLSNVSQPKISLLSGTTAQFRNGTSIQYVSKIAPGVLMNGSWTAGSADTAVLQTGLTMTIAGDISDGTVFSDISLRLADLIRMDKQQVSVSQGVTTTISLPVSADREVNARVRARPGDAIIVGGINLQRVNNSYNGVGPIPMASDRQAQRSELVIILIPRVTHFVHAADSKEEK